MSKFPHLNRKPYRFRNLIRAMVFLVMIFSGILVFSMIVLLRAFHLLPSVFFARFWMPALVILTGNIVGAVLYAMVVPQFVKPVEDIIYATDVVAKGDFTVRVPSDEVTGEMKELVDSFNKMTEELGGIEIFRSDFINHFSHEFKTPIVSMQGFAKQLKKKDLTDEEREQYCDIIISESKRLTNMSTNILLLTRFENQKIISDKENFSLSEQIRSCILLLEKEWTEKEIDLEIDMEEISIFNNPEMLHLVWLNLIGNAVKFTPVGGKVAISAHRGENGIHFSVSDTGKGMNEEELRHIYEKFYQADRSHSSSGNGLGLCIVKRIVDLEGGKISVSSEKGKGTVFSVFLPE